MYKRLGPTALMIYTQSATPTEFALILNHLKGTRIECPTVADLGFANGVTRTELYPWCAQNGLFEMEWRVAHQVMLIARPGDGTLHIATGSYEMESGKWCYGFVIDWPEGDFRCRHDIVFPTHVLQPDHRVVLARQRRIG